MQEVIDQLTGYLDENDPGGVLAVYVTGSAAMDGLRPDSDIDFVLVTGRALTRAERRGWLEFVLKTSPPPGGSARSLELTSIAVDDIVPWRYPPVCDLLYGEWLRGTFAPGAVPERHPSPDLAILLSTLLQHSAVVRGPAPRTLIDPVPAADLRRAVLDSVPSVRADLVGDERNVILTLARMLVTVSSGEIVSKERAARQIGSTLPEPDRTVVSLAAAGYLGQVQDDWTAHRREVQETADHLVDRIRTIAAGSIPP